VRESAWSNCCILDGGRILCLEWPISRITRLLIWGSLILAWMNTRRRGNKYPRASMQFALRRHSAYPQIEASAQEKLVNCCMKIARNPSENKRSVGLGQWPRRMTYPELGQVAYKFAGCTRSSMILLKWRILAKENYNLYSLQRRRKSVRDQLVGSNPNSLIAKFDEAMP
jgi:hypothetical protein